MNPETDPSPAPQKGTAPALNAVEVPAAVPSAPAGRGPAPDEVRPGGPRAPGEPYTRMPVFSRPAFPRWAYYAAAALLALILALSLAWLIRPAGRAGAAPAETPAAAQSGAAGGAGQ